MFHRDSYLPFSVGAQLLCNAVIVKDNICSQLLLTVTVGSSG